MSLAASGWKCSWQEDVDPHQAVIAGRFAPVNERAEGIVAGRPEDAGVTNGEFL